MSFTLLVRGNVVKGRKDLREVWTSDIKLKQCVRVNDGADGVEGSVGCVLNRMATPVGGMSLPSDVAGE